MASPKSIFDDIQPASIFDEISLPAAGSKAEPARSGRWRVTPGEAEARWEPSAPAVPPQQKPMVPNSIGRTLALGTRDVLEGVAQVPGMALDALALPGNLVARAYNSMTPGTYRIGITPPASQTFSNAFDAVGMPTAQTDGERLASAINKGAASALTGAGAANVAARTLTGIGQEVARVLASQPAMQVASGVVGGGVGEATDSPVAGMIAGALTPVAVAGARRIISPVANVNSPGRANLVSGAEREGIPVTAGQATGSDFLQNIEAKLRQLPFTSGPQRAINDEQKTKFIEAVWRKAGQNLSDTSPETILASKNKIGGAIGAIAERNTMKMTPEVDTALLNMAEILKQNPAFIGGDVIKEIREIFRLSSAQAQSPSIPGTIYRKFDTILREKIQQTTNSDLAAEYQKVKDIMRGAMNASISPEDAAAWDTARRQYANFKVIQNAAGQAGAGAAEGVMSPVALRGALIKSIGPDKYAEGFGDLNELARIGQGPLRPRPDSGTSGLSDASSMLRGGGILQHGLSIGGAGGGAAVGGPVGAVAGAALPYALPRVIQMMMNSGPGQAYLRNQVAADPVMTKNLARALALHGAIQNNNTTGP